MSWLDSVFGQKIDIHQKGIKPREVTPAGTQADAIAANIKNIGDITKQGDLYSQYLQSAIEKQLPDYFTTLAKGSEVGLQIEKQAAQEAQGMIPQDVQDTVMRSGAYQNLLSGGGNNYLRSLQARDLGLTSLDLIRQGAALNASNANTAAQWSNLAQSTIYNIGRDFVTPAQSAALAQWNEQRRQAFKVQQAQINAAPDPTAKGVSDTLIGLISAYLSKGGGGASATQPANPYSTGTIYQGTALAPTASDASYAGANDMYGQPIGGSGGGGGASGSWAAGDGGGWSPSVNTTFSYPAQPDYLNQGPYAQSWSGFGEAGQPGTFSTPDYFNQGPGAGQKYGFNFGG